MRVSRDAILRSLQWTLAIAGIGLLSWVGLVRLQAERFRANEVRELARSPRRSAPADIVLRPRPTTLAERRAFAGLLEIPRLGLSAAFAEGDDDATLRKAIGHLPDTPLPWEPGNAAFAGHRDQQFRPLRGIRDGDEVRLVTARGTYTYRVTDTVIVDPDDVWVLAPSSTGRQLTLITCYPFSYIGHAPHRFVVLAEAAER